jgi:hypothetical protein
MTRPRTRRELDPALPVLPNELVSLVGGPRLLGDDVEPLSHEIEGPSLFDPSDWLTR